MLQPRDYQLAAFEAGLAHARQSVEPCILELGTAAGKSIIVSMLAHTVQKAGKRTLVLCPNGDLVLQNSGKYRDLGERCSIYSAKLGKKHTGHPVVFATPISVAKNLKDFGAEYALLVIDECHGVSEDENTSYQKIIRHLQEVNPKLRILGLTATPVRFKTKLVDEDATFKHAAFKMLSHQLSAAGWTVPFTLGVTHEEYHLSNIKVQSNGKFKQSEVDAETLGKERLTRAIVQDAVKVMEQQQRRCGLFFAASLQHAAEILSYLPGAATIIDGNTLQVKREAILSEARRGGWKYLVNVGTLTTGTDLPIVDTIALLRATESIGLLLQILGRGCRLYDPEWPGPAGELNRLHPDYQGKQDCLVLDYGGNIDRFSLDDDLTITGLVEAKNKHDDDDEFFEIACPDCGTANRHTAQRCVGIVNQIRCQYRFIFKTCQHCEAQNSPSARYCHRCKGELIDPNEKLTRKAAVGAGIPFQVAVMDMKLRPHWKGESQTLRVDYNVTDGSSSWQVSEFMKPKNYAFHKFSSLTGATGETVDDIVAAACRIKVPTRLLIKKQRQSKYYEVVTRYA